MNKRAAEESEQRMAEFTGKRGYNEENRYRSLEAENFELKRLLEEDGQDLDRNLASLAEFFENVKRYYPKRFQASVRPQTLEGLKEEMQGIRAKAAEQQEAISLRASVIYELTQQNTELVKSVGAIRKVNTERMDKLELLGKRGHFEDYGTKNIGVQTQVDQENKGVQVFRYLRSVGESCEASLAARRADEERVAALMKLLGGEGERAKTIMGFEEDKGNEERERREEKTLIEEKTHKARLRDKNIGDSKDLHKGNMYKID
jgi:hypothetical protein